MICLCTLCTYFLFRTIFFTNIILSYIIYFGVTLILDYILYTFYIFYTSFTFAVIFYLTLICRNISYFNIAICFTLLTFLLLSHLLDTTEDYPSKLLEVIDPEQLPAYYGGTKRDPDGNPKCETLVHSNKSLKSTIYRSI